MGELNFIKTKELQNNILPQKINLIFSVKSKIRRHGKGPGRRRLC